MYIFLRKKTEFNRHLSRLNYIKTPETHQYGQTMPPLEARGGGNTKC